LCEGFNTSYLHGNGRSLLIIRSFIDFPFFMSKGEQKGEGKQFSQSHIFMSYWGLIEMQANMKPSALLLNPGDKIYPAGIQFYLWMRQPIHLLVPLQSVNTPRAK